MDWTGYEVEGQMSIFDYIEEDVEEFDLSKHMNPPEGENMDREDVLRIGLLLSEINNKVGWVLSQRIRDEVSEIEDIVAKYSTEPQKTEKQKLEERLAELEQRIFDLKMKDRWDSSDSYQMDQMYEESRKIKEKLNEVQ